jgi:hypothetical protein
MIVGESVEPSPVAAFSLPTSLANTSAGHGADMTTSATRGNGEGLPRSPYSPLTWTFTDDEARPPPSAGRHVDDLLFKISAQVDGELVTGRPQIGTPAPLLPRVERGAVHLRRRRFERKGGHPRAGVMGRAWWRRR